MIIPVDVFHLMQNGKLEEERLLNNIKKFLEKAKEDCNLDDTRICFLKVQVIK